MATSLHSESRHSYSWWWDSHISPKNSKWLQDNLTDIDGKVKSMIKIINEDADSFARRAEMYYKKRPELMKLVEEFYRAYRALAERYDHATGELRLAHRTMIEAFPNQVSFMPGDDTPDPDEPNKDSDAGLRKTSLKQLNEIFQSGEAMLKELKTAEERLMGNLQEEKDKDSSSKHRRSSLSSDKNHNLDLRTMILNQSDQARKVEAEMQRLKQALAKMEAERDAALVQYQQSSEKLSDLETELNSAQADAKELDKHASEAQSEVEALKASLCKVEAERDSSLCQFKDASKRLASLEAMATAAQGDVMRWRDQAVEGETEIQNLKKELSRSETEKHGALAQYNESLGKISGLEEKLRIADENSKRLYEQNEQAKCETKVLKDELFRLTKEKEDACLRYEQSLDMISKLQDELMEAKEEVKRLKSAILLESAMLKGVEDQCALLEKMNQSLKLEANDLVQEIAAKDRQLSEKQTELEKLMNRLQGEQSSFMQVEATLHALQNVHFQSQQEQRALALELRNGLQMLKDLELCKRDLEVEIHCLREENQGLTDLKLSSSVAEKDMQQEIKSVEEIKEKLEAEVKRHMELNEVLQKQFDHLKEELEDLYKKYQDLLQQVESAGIDPNCLKSSIKGLQDENSWLKQVANDGKIEKEGLLRRLQDMEGLVQRSSMLGSSFVDVKVELESSKEKMKALQESCNTLSGEKSNLVAEKTALLSQLKIITDSMQKLLENNITLEKSLQGANIELEGLRVKSKSLEDFCQYLKDDKSNLQTERSGLVYRLECVEKKLEELVTRFAKLEDKCADLEKERNSTHNQVAELRISLGAEKQKHECLMLTNESRLSGLEDHIRHLQEENKGRKKDFEEQLEKAVNAQVEIIILQKFMKDMEEKHCTLLAECQKQAETAKYSEMIISELESDNMMQHLETEYLLDRVDKLRRGICQVLKALEIDHVSESDPEIFLPHVRGKIKDIRRNISESKDENQQLLIQNNVLSAVVKQLSSEGQELTTQKEAVDHEFFLLNQQHVMLENEKSELLERSRQLDIEVVEKHKGQETLKAQMEGLNLKQEALEKEYVVLQKERSDLLKTNGFLQEKLLGLEEEKHMLEEENSGAIAEALSFSTRSVVFKSSWVQATFELGRVAHGMCCLQEAYRDLEYKAKELEEKLAKKETENIQLRGLIQQLEEKKQVLHVCNYQLNQQCALDREQLNQKEADLHMAEQRIQTTQDMNTELNTTIEGLKVRYEALDVTRGNLEQQISELTECREHQKKEIVLLREANGSLESDVGELSEEIEACKIREVILSSELLERNSEFELWEAEATSFYFDLQISSVHGTFLESKVRELSGLCADLEDVSARRSAEMERMKNKISHLETESEGLKIELAAYVPVIASLKDNITSLEQTPVLQTKLYFPGRERQQVAEFMVKDISESNLANAKEKSSSLLDGLSELQDLQSRIKAIESILVVQKTSLQDRVNANIKLEAATEEIEKLKSITNSQPNIVIHDAERKDGNLCGKYLEFGPGTPEFRNGTHMKDIPLDHVSNASSSSSRRRRSGRLSDHILELSEAPDLDPTLNLTLSKTRAPTSPPWHIQLEIGELTDSNPREIEKELDVDKLEVSKSVGESKHGRNNRKAVLERLASDAQKLASLQMLIQELGGKIENNKKTKATNDVEHTRLKTQLQDVENSVLQLVDMNTELAQTIKENPSSSDSTEPVEVEQAMRGDILEQTRRDSERIVSLQLEMQKIEHIFLKLDDERNNNTRRFWKSRFSRIRTGIILREFVYSHGRRSRKQKNPRFCGCFRPSHK